MIMLEITATKYGEQSLQLSWAGYATLLAWVTQAALLRRSAHILGPLPPLHVCLSDHASQFDPARGAKSALHICSADHHLTQGPVCSAAAPSGTASTSRSPGAP